MATIANRKHNAASVVEIDAGKFLRIINTGARSQLALFEDRIRKMGQEIGSNWRLISLDSTALMFEDVDNECYYRADVERLKHGNVKISGIRQVRLVEAKKGEQFSKNVYELVNCLAEDDNKGADAVFNRITAQRFRGTVIPENRLVTTRDGITRKIYLNRGISEQSLRNIVESVCKSLKNNVKILRGRVVEATFGGSTFKLPINEYQQRQTVAKSMKQVAQNAYLSEGFQKRVKDIAAFVSQDKLEEAVRNAADFLIEQQ
jgi:hypothetical protein